MVHSTAKKDPVSSGRSKITDSSFDLLFDKFKGDKQAEDALVKTFAKVERAKQEWESTVDALPELICVVDSNGRIVRTNRTVEHWGLGSVVHVQGIELHELVHPDCQAPCYLDEILKQAQQKKGKVQSIEHEIFDPNLHRFILTRVKPITMKDKSATGHFVVILQDITVRKKVEEALQRQNNRLATMNTINHAILNARSPEEIAQATLMNIQDLVPYQQAQVLISLPESKEFLVLASADDGTSHFLKSGNKLADAAFANRKNRDLKKFFVAEDLNLLSNPNPLERLLIKNDIQTYINLPLMAEENFIGMLQLATLEPTTFKPFQIEILREISGTLTVAIHQSQLNQKLKRTNEELRGLLRAKHEMLENVTHELRSPLALIKGYTELLKEGLLGPLTDEQLDALQILDTKGDQLFFLVSRLFTLQTVNKHTLQKVPINPKSLLNETVKSWQVLTNNNNVHLKLDVPQELPVLMADSNLLNQVLTNLLDNALKYSPEASTITIRAEENDHQLIISVADQGPGIPADKIEQIFERFYQIEKGTTKAKPGAGIGLALCTAIIEAHEGRLWAESDGEDKGSTFIVSLPIET